MRLQEPLANRTQTRSHLRRYTESLLVGALLCTATTAFPVCQERQSPDRFVAMLSNAEAVKDWIEGPDPSKAASVLASLEFTPGMGSAYFDLCLAALAHQSVEVQFAAAEALSAMRSYITVPQNIAFCDVAEATEKRDWGRWSRGQALAWIALRESVVNMMLPDMDASQVEEALAKGHASTRAVRSIALWRDDVDPLPYLEKCAALVALPGPVERPAVTNPSTLAAAIFAAVHELSLEEEASSADWYNALIAEHHCDLATRESAVRRLTTGRRGLEVLANLIAEPGPLRNVALARAGRLGHDACALAWAVRPCLQEPGVVGALAERAYRSILGIKR